MQQTKDDASAEEHADIKPLPIPRGWLLIGLTVLSWVPVWLVFLLVRAVANGGSP
jgi:hypothetical protein